MLVFFLRCLSQRFSIVIGYHRMFQCKKISATVMFFFTSTLITNNVEVHITGWLIYTYGILKVVPKNVALWFPFGFTHFFLIRIIREFWLTLFSDIQLTMDSIQQICVSTIFFPVQNTSWVGLNNFRTQSFKLPSKFSWFFLPRKVFMHPQMKKKHSLRLYVKSINCLRYLYIIGLIINGK